MQEEAMAVAASLEGVTYEVRFVLWHHLAASEERGGRADEGPSARLVVDALAPWGQVQAMVESELGAAADGTPLCLTFGGAVLPLDAPVAMTGVGDGDTVVVVAGGLMQPGSFEECYSDLDSQDSLDDAMQRFAGHDL
jgi:hypothetical protein